MYTKRFEEFLPLVPTFTDDIWAMLIQLSLDPKNDIVSEHACPRMHRDARLTISMYYLAGVPCPLLYRRRGQGWQLPRKVQQCRDTQGDLPEVGAGKHEYA